MKRNTLILSSFVIVKFLLQYVLISPVYDLQRDEYLHLDQAHHLAWGYLSVPPFTSWVSYLIYVLGNSVFWIRFFPALFGALTLIVVWKAMEELKGNLFALVLGAACILFSVLLRLNTLYQPNSFDVLSWTAFYYFTIKYFNSKNTNWLFAAAIAFAFGFLNKYNIAFLLFGFLPAVLLTKERKLFLQPRLYFAFGFALLLVLPNLIWQYNNNFPVIHHMQELARTQLVHVNRIDFLKSQVLFFAGSFVVILSGWVALTFYKPFAPFKSFFWCLPFTLIIFMYFKAKDYYAIGLYPIYISFGAVWISKILQHDWKRYLQPVAIAIPLLFFIPFYKIGFPNKTPEEIIQHQQLYKDFGLLRWEDGKDHALPQDFADMLGWKELAVKVDSVYATMPHPAETLVYCDNYGQAGAINYYKQNKQFKARSLHADYMDWFPFDQKIIDVVLIKETLDKDKERKTEKLFFDSVYLAAQRINPNAREDTISIYVLRGAKININDRMKAEFLEKKKYK